MLEGDDVGISITVSSEIRDQIDEIVAKEGFKSRNEFIVEAIKEKLASYI